MGTHYWEYWAIYPKAQWWGQALIWDGRAWRFCSNSSQMCSEMCCGTTTKVVPYRFDHPCLMVLLFCTGMPSCWKQRLEFQTVPKEGISLNVLVSGSLNSSLWKAGSQSFYNIDIKRQNNCFNITGRFTATVNLHSNFGAIRKWH